MMKTMLVDATHPEETRVAIVEQGNRLSDFDFERTSKKQLKGNIYLAKVIRVEPSLQACFVEYGGNRHGFLSFSEIHPDYYRIPVADRPHDEPIDDDSDDLALGDDTSDDISAYADEQQEIATQAAAEKNGAQPQLTEAYGELPLGTPVEAPISSAITPINDFIQDSSHDLGLITDFAAAGVNTHTDVAMDAAMMAAPEIVGGEPMEVEQREIRPRRQNYKIQEVIKRRQVMLIQVVKEERGNKGAALTTFLSLAGRYCVLMPNTDHGGGVSRKITSHQDRRRMKDLLDKLEVPEGMAIILRTAGMEQEPAEIQRDLEYLLRLWNSIREETLQSTAPTMIYEEANLIKRTLRDLTSNDLDSILVAGQKGYQLAHDFMHTIMPDCADKVKLYEDPIPLFFRYSVEKQIDQLYNPIVQLRSGGYIVINPTEALVSIDVNSGRATRERHIESTALKTNLEAAEEIARQLRLRDLAGLVVIDFIDMEDGRNNAAVERRMKESMKIDRARLQIGRISPFGLLELSRQRIHASLMEINFEKCPHCAGLGLIRSVDSAAISILRVIEEEGLKTGGGDLTLHVPTKISLYILNQKRAALADIEKRYGLQVLLHCDDTLPPSEHRLERARGAGAGRERGPAVNTEQVFADAGRELPPPPPAFTGVETADPVHQPVGTPDNRTNGNGGQQNRENRGRSGYGRGRNSNNRNQHQNNRPHHNNAPDQACANGVNGNVAASEPVIDDSIGNTTQATPPHNGFVPRTEGGDEQRRGGRRRGRRGGRGRHGGNNGAGFGGQPHEGNQQHQPRDNNWRHGNQGAPDQAPTVAAPILPSVNIHDILDTTPRPPRENAPNAPQQPYVRPRPEQSVAPTSPPPYEVINEASDNQPKGGWWRRLTGQ